MSRRAQVNPKLVLMTADTIGGVWTYSLELARALARNDVEVALATMGRPMSREQAHEASSVPNLQVFESNFKLEWMDDPWSDIAKAGEWLLELESRNKPDVVHLNGYGHAALPWKAPTLVAGHSCVLSWWRAVHHHDAPEDWNTYRQVVTAGLQAANMVVAPSRTMLDCLQELYGPLKCARVIPNGRSLPLLTPRPKEKFILSAGRLWDEAKNVATLASIASALPWPTYLAGETRKSSEEFPQDGSLHMLGHLPSEQVVPWFARASIYCLPAKYEPFGLSVLEAAMAGCALVLGDLPSLRELWDSAALFVPPEEAGALREALLELISSPVWIAGLGAKARWAAWRFTPEKMVDAYLSAYAQIVQSQRRTRAGRPRPELSSALAKSPAKPEEVRTTPLEGLAA